MEAQAAGGAVAAGSGGFLSFLPVGLSICVGGLAVLLYMFQDKLLYFPSMPPNARTAFVPAHLYNLQNDLVETFITTKDNIKLQAYFVPNQRGQATNAVPTFLYFHGNAGNLSYRLPNVKQLVATVGVNVLIVSYRGYGKSEGTPSEEGLRLDAEAALDYLFYGGEDIDPKKVVVFGRSLGGAVALRLAADHQDKVAAVVVENTFTSIPDMIDVVLRWLSPFKFLSRNKWSSKDVVSELTMPVLYLSGEKDELVPARMMRELYDRSTSSRKRHIIYFAEGYAFSWREEQDKQQHDMMLMMEGTHTHRTHMDTFMQPGYYEKVKSWLRSVFDQTAQNQGEEEGEVEEVLNEEHELITSEGEEVQVALVNNTL